jgi:hypothetical protein
MSRAVTLFGALVPCRRLTRRRCNPVAVNSSRSVRSTFVDGGVESRIPRYLYVSSTSEEAVVALLVHSVDGGYGEDC